MNRPSVTDMLTVINDYRLRNDHVRIVDEILASGRDVIRYPDLGIELVSALITLRRDAEAYDLVAKLAVSSSPKLDRTLLRRIHIYRAILLTRFGKLSEVARDIEVVLMGGYAGLDRLTAEATNTTGITCLMRGNWDEAKATFRRALAQYQILGLPRGIAATNHNLGITLSEQGAFEDAEKHFIEADQFFAVAGVVHDCIGTCIERTLAVRGLGDIRRSEHLIGWALAQARRIRSNHLVGEALRVQGILFGSQGDFSGARTAFDEAFLQIAKTNNQHVTGQIAQAYAEVEMRAGNRPAALAKLQQAWSCFSAVGAAAYAERTAMQIQHLEHEEVD